MIRTPSALPAASARSAKAIAVLCGLFVAQQALGFTVSNTPAFMPTPLSPNILITLDDSGSMARAWVPDELVGDPGSPDANITGSRRFKSATFNSLYYDPSVVYTAPVDALGNPLTSSFTAAPINGFANGASGPSNRGTVNLSIGYRPTQTYNPANTGQTFAQHPDVKADLDALRAESLLQGGSPSDPMTRTEAAPAYYYVFDSKAPGCPSPVKSDELCYRLVIVSATSGTNPAVGPDERQNFANWYSFYRTRNLLTVAAASLVFRPRVPTTGAGLDDTIRVAWQSLSTCTQLGSGCNNWVSGRTTHSGMRALGAAISPTNPTGSHRGNLYDWLFRLPASGTTPLRTAMSRAGEYFRRNAGSNPNNPYLEFPQENVNPNREFSCRPNFHILMTDGVWNNNNDLGSRAFCGGSTCGNRDGSNSWLTGGSLPDGTAFNLSLDETRFYRDSNNDSLADIAFYYWATDLRPDLKNDQIKYRPDRTGDDTKQFWNPKNDWATWQHMVNFTVGLGLTNTFSVSSLPWPTEGDSLRGTGFDNLKAGTATWPATGANASGAPANEEVSPGNVYDLWHAAINSRGRAFSADTPKQLTDALQAALNRILEQKSSAAAATVNSTRVSGDGDGGDTLVFQARFDSSDWSGVLEATRLDSTGKVAGKAWATTDLGKIPAPGSRRMFTWNGTAGIPFEKDPLDAAGLWPSIAAAPPAAELDILNYFRGDSSKEQKSGGPYRNRSTPLGDIVNSDPLFVWRENYGYTKVPEGASSSPTPYRSFVETKRSRSKMLYVGSNDGMLHAFDASTGEERFAFVPRALTSELKKLAAPDYAHQFFVDGAPTSWDAFLGGQWRTVLVGTTGAGGRSIFALDINNPDSFTEANILWEIDSTTPRRTADSIDPRYDQDLGLTMGQGVVVKLNNGEWAVVFGNGYTSANQRAVLYVVRLSDGALLQKIDTGVGSSGQPNGLGTPTLYDANDDDVYDVAYAADMRGNIWKFDLTATGASSWGVAFSGVPLFVASSASGGVQPIQARIELARPPAGIPGVMVLVGTGRLFAINDNTDLSPQTFYGLLDNGSRIAGRAQLRQQSILSETGGFRTSTGADVDFAGGQRGWYLDLPTPGERVIGTALIFDDRALFTTVIPSNDPCEFSGTGWLMQVDARHGKQRLEPLFDENKDGSVNSGDVPYSGVASLVGLVKRGALLDGDQPMVMMTGTRERIDGGGPIQDVRIRRGGVRTGRDSWREVTQ